MGLHRYSPSVEITNNDVDRYAESGGVVTRKTLVAVDITLNNDADKPGFDEYMATLGAQFQSSDPTGALYAVFNAGVSTPNNTPAVALSIPTEDNNTYLVRAQMSARAVSGVSGAFAFDGAFRRDAGAGTLVQIGLTSILSTMQQDLTWTAGFQVNVSTGAIELVVTGASAEVVRWFGWGLITQVE